MEDRVERKRMMILKILKEADTPLSSMSIQGILKSRGIDISERTVRFHLQALDQDGITRYQGKKGRFLTAKGIEELSRAHIIDKVGFLSARIDDLNYRMNFDCLKKTGTVLVNVSLVRLVRIEDLPETADLMKCVFKSKLTMGSLMALFAPGERIDKLMIPEGFAGIGTVCSITVNGVLLAAGIPVSSHFGGLLEIHDNIPDRFTAIIKYDGSTLDPLEIYIKSGMTSCGEVAKTGNGLIGASFREIPAICREHALSLFDQLRELGMDGVVKIGYPGQNLLDIPVADGRCGMIVAGGLNAVSILEEKGIEVQSHALSGLVDFPRLFHYSLLADKISEIFPPELD